LLPVLLAVRAGQELPPRRSRRRPARRLAPCRGGPGCRQARRYDRLSL